MKRPRGAIVLAAGRGERLRPLTDTTPKALLRAGGRALIEWQIERLVAGGFADIVVNHAHLGQQIESALGDGARLGARIRYSPESPALETAGGIARALPLLGEGPFAVVSADIHTDFDYARFAPVADDMAERRERRVAHLVLVENPPYHAEGDMGLAEGLVTRARPWLTFASIGVFHPAIFADIAAGTKLRLFPWVYRYADEGRITGEIYGGPWDNVGTSA
ncbi:MAG: N-acetylmuramate alpha-1-phosphate uridylyltransferase MurU, partial [Terriglobales bacterium]